MSRALFSVLPQNDGLQKLLQELLRIGVTAHNVSTLRIESHTHAPPGPRPAHHSTTISAPLGNARSGATGEIPATGQLRWALQGACSTGATRRVARALAGMGLPELSARRYQDLVQMGNTLLCVFCETSSQAKQAVTVLHRCGAREVASTGAPVAEERTERSTPVGARIQ